MESNFYSFDIDYEAQLKTNWCWCACFSWVSKSLKLNTPFKEQYHFQNYYRSHILELEALDADEFRNGESNYLVDTKSDHVGRLIEETLKMDYRLIDVMAFDQNRNDRLKETFDLKKLITNLMSNKAPWIVATDHHMFVISGFGCDVFRDYILVSDPDLVANEKFIPVNIFIDNYGKRIRKIWQLTHKEENDLIYNQSSEITFEYENQSSFQPEYFDTYILKSDVAKILPIEQISSNPINQQMAEHIT